MQPRPTRSVSSPSALGVPQYEAFYGFQDPPFRLVPDPDYLFLSLKHRQAMGHLLSGVREGSGISVLTGKVGTGKTTLARAVVRDLEPEATAAYIFYPPSSPLELLQAINAELGLSSVSMREKELVDILNRYLLEQSEAGRRVFIVIDEAQRLEAVVLEHLRLLSNLETQKEKLLPIILVGQPELKDLLARSDLEQLSQRIISRWDLAPLNKAESAAYIRHRLEVAGGAKATYLFPTKALHEAHRFSRGVPRVLNMVCHRALTLGYAKEERTLTLATVRQAIRELRSETKRDQPFWFFPRLEASSLAWSVLLGAIAVGLAVATGIGAARYFSSPVDTLPLAGGSQDALISQSNSSPAPEAMERALASSLHEPGRAIVSAREPVDSAALQPIESTAIMVDALERETFLNELSQLDPAQSLAQATEKLLQTLEVKGLEKGEAQGKLLDLKRIARARRLTYLPLRGNLTLLTLLDRPVILELFSSEQGEIRFVPLLRLTQDTGRVFLGQERELPLNLIEEHWRGKAHLFWRNVDNIRSSLTVGSAGPSVIHLHRLLTQAAWYRGPLSSVFTKETQEAVKMFQRANRFEPDGIAGPFTLISLYNSGYTRHSLRAGRVLTQADADFWRKGEGVYFKIGELSVPAKGEP